MRRHVFSPTRLSRRIVVAADRSIEPLKYRIEQLEKRVLLAGNLAWGSYLGGSTGEGGSAIAVDSSGNTWIVGDTTSTDFASGGFDSTFGGVQDAFVAKINANGTLAWVSYLGGSAKDWGTGIALDGSGNAWITGGTASSDFPGGGFDSSYNGGTADAYVAKINSNGTFAWGSYLGGSSTDHANDIAVDGAGNAWITGSTFSTNFPGGGFDATSNGNEDAFVAKINANGTLAWGSYLGGSSVDNGIDIEVDGSGNAWVTGLTLSGNFPGGGFDSGLSGAQDIFIAKVNANGTLAWGSYLGGTGDEYHGNEPLAIDGSGNAWVTGLTYSADFPGGGFDSSRGGAYDGFVAKVNANGTFGWGSYLGGSAGDSSSSITIDGSGDAWITGTTLSSDFPGGGFDPNANGNEDAYVAKVNANGTLAWGSYLGGSGDDRGLSIAADGSGTIWVTGWTTSTDFPGGGFDSSLGGIEDAFVAKILPSKVAGSYIGGSVTESGEDIAIDGAGNAWIVGYTSSPDFPGGGFDSTYNGGTFDVFLAKVTSGDTLAWGTYLGGSGNDRGYCTAVDGSGNVWIAGLTTSSNLPGGGFDSSYNGGEFDAFVAKVNANGTLSWCSYLGGSAIDEVLGIALDGVGNAWVTGHTTSTDFPVGGFDPSYNGGAEDAFVAKINADGTLAWGSYLGGSGGREYGLDIAIDSSGNAWISGCTGSADLPGGGFDSTYNGGIDDAFLAKVNADGSLAWTSYLGGAGEEHANSIQIDDSGDVWVAGYTRSTNFPGGGFDPSYNGGSADAFLAKVTANGVFVWGSYLGGSAEEIGEDLSIDPWGNVWFTGGTASADFPGGGFDPTLGGVDDAFVAKFNVNGTLDWGSHLGGSGSDIGYGIAADGGGNVWLTGRAESTDFPGGGFDPLYNGGTNDAFVAKVMADPIGNAAGPYTLFEGISLQLNASGTVNPGSRPLTYAWDVNGDGVYTDASGVSPSLSWSQLTALGINDGPATWTNVRVKVTDDLGGSSTSPATTLTVQDTPPTLTISGNATVAKGANYTLNLSATDPGSDTIGGWQITWETGDVQTIVGNPSSVTHAYSTVGSVMITATATNEDGTFAANSLLLAVEKSIDWGSYFGGSSDDVGQAVAVDGLGNTWIAGHTRSPGLATGGFDTTIDGQDAFVAKINTDGTLGWSSYLGGANDEVVTAVAVDQAGSVWVTGWTTSSGWVTGGFDSTHNGGTYDGYVAKITDDGTLAWSSYLGGTAADTVFDIAFDQAGDAWICGSTNSSNLPATGYDTSYNGNGDGFFGKVSPDGALVLLSYFGGSAGDAALGVSLDLQNRVWITGDTSSSDLALAGFDATYNGGTLDAFIAQLNSNGSLAWSSYLGGGGEDRGRAIDVDLNGDAWLTGWTTSVDLPGGGSDSTYNGSSDGFVAKVAAGGACEWTSYLGGANYDAAEGIVADAFGGAIITGWTDSAGWISDAVDASYNGGASDAFVLRVNDEGSFSWSSYIGGSGEEGGNEIEIGDTGSVWVIGWTDSTDFPTLGGFDVTYGGGVVYGDAFVAQVLAIPVAQSGGPCTSVEGGSLLLDASSTQNPGSRPLTYAWDLNNDGNFTDASGVTPTLTWSQLVALGINDGPATWNNIRVRVSDDLGNVSTSAATTLTVQDTPPTVIITGTGFINAGASYNLNLSATDPGNDTVSSWTITWAPGDVQVVTGDPSSVSHVFASTGYYLISATATNEDSTFASNSLPVNVGPIQTGPTIVYVSDVSLPEGDTPGVQAAVQITRTGDWTDAISIDYTTANGSAIAGTDYQSKSGTLILESGQASTTVYVPITSNLIAQPDRSFTFTISNVRAVSAGVPSFSSSVLVRAGAGLATSAAADINNDGRPDLVVGNWYDSTISVLVNTTQPGAATPSFGVQQVFPTAHGPRGLAIADINGDGRLDVLTANRSEGAFQDTFSVLMNNGVIGSSTVSFTTHQDFVTASVNTSRIAVGDINRDGRIDVAVAIQDGAKVSTFLNTTTPGSAIASFSARTDVAVPGRPFDLSLTDVTEDGRADLIVAGFESAVISVLPSTTSQSATTPSFAARQDLSTAGGTGSPLAVGDVDGDGMPDLLAGDTPSLFLNRHHGFASDTARFAPRQALPFPVAASCLVVDLNNDGKPEMAAADNSVLTVIENRSDGQGDTIELGVKRTFANADGGWITSADFNLDGRTDVSTVFSAGMWVLLNTTAVRTSLPQFTRTTATTGSLPHAATTGDLNADGKPDLVTANQGDGTISVLVNTTTPGAATSLFLPKQDFLTGAFCVWTSIADFNLDGKPDVVAANAGPNTVSVLLNATAPQSNTIALSAKADFLTGNRPRSVATGDFNLDGRPDIVTANSWGNTVAVLVNATTPGSPTVAFTARQEFLAGAGAVSVAVGDLNGDGKLDLVVANENDNNVAVLLNATTPGSTSLAFTSTQTFAVGTGPRSVALGDINGDGKLDIATANQAASTGNTASVLLNTTTPGSGTPSFMAQQVFTTGIGPISVTVGDISGDGHGDLLIANITDDTVSILRNVTPPGSTLVSFDPAVNLAVGNAPIFVGVADLTLDGRPDIVAANFDGNTVSVLANTPVSVSQAVATVTILDDDAVPQATASHFHFETAPHYVEFTFSKNVGASIDLNDLSIVRLRDNVQIAPAAVSYDALSNTARWNLPVGMENGNYLAVVNGIGVFDSAGRQLPGPATLPFYILWGDANRDRKVSTLDFNILVYNFGMSSGAIFSKGDFNLDTQVDSVDFGIYLANYGTVVVAPGPLPMTMAVAQPGSLFARHLLSDESDLSEALMM